MSTSSADPVLVRILGRDYYIACAPAEREALESAALLLHERMKTIRDSGKVTGMERIAVMAALNITHEYAAAGAREAECAQRTSERLRLLRRRLEQAIARGRQIAL